MTEEELPRAPRVRLEWAKRLGAAAAAAAVSLLSRSEGRWLERRSLQAGILAVGMGFEIGNLSAFWQARVGSCQPMHLYTVWDTARAYMFGPSACSCPLCSTCDALSLSFSFLFRRPAIPLPLSFSSVRSSRGGGRR